MTVTFDSVVLRNPEQPDQQLDIATSKTRLLSGKIRVQSSTEVGEEISFKCHTEDYTDISNLIAKIGVPGTLSIDGVSHTKCYIDQSFRITKFGDDNWIYEVKFVRDTT